MVIDIPSAGICPSFSLSVNADGEIRHSLNAPVYGVEGQAMQGRSAKWPLGVSSPSQDSLAEIMGGLLVLVRLYGSYGSTGSIPARWGQQVEQGGLLFRS
jgi:hypothetical protein